MGHTVASDKERFDSGVEARPVQTFSRLYEEHVSSVFAYCYARTGHRQDAEDATEQTFLQAWRAYGRYREQGVPVRAWLLRIASNVVIDAYRRRRIRPSYPLEDADCVIDPTSQPPEVAEMRETFKDIKQALLTLPEDYQQVVTLRFSQDMRLAEIAQTMGRSEGSVKMLLHRAINALRLQLNPDSGDNRGKRHER